MINKNDLRKAISSIAISNAKRNTIYKAFSDLDSITKEEFDSVKSDISKVVESMLTKDTVGKANGVASLDSNGSVPIEQLGNIDTTLFLIVRELPTADIKSNKIYLVPNEDGQGNNVYVEYLYVENVWEKVGEFKPDINYDEIISKVEEKVVSIDNNNNIIGSFYYRDDGDGGLAKQTFSDSNRSIAIGFSGDLDNECEQCICIGYGNVCNGLDSIAIGENVISYSNSVCIGRDIASSMDSVVLGQLFITEDSDDLEGRISIGWKVRNNNISNVIYQIGGYNNNNSESYYNLEETLDYDNEHKKYIYGIGNYNGTTTNNVKSLQEVLNEKADTSAIPTKTSQLTNDSSFATENYVADEISIFKQIAILNYNNTISGLFDENDKSMQAWFKNSKSIIIGFSDDTDLHEIPPHNTVSIGNNVSYKGDNNVYIGNEIEANGDNNVLIGRNITHDGNNSVVIGSNNTSFIPNGYITIGYDIYPNMNAIYQIAGHGGNNQYNLEETLTYDNQHKKYIYGIGGYDGTNSDTEGVKSLQEVLAGKADASAYYTKTEIDSKGYLTAHQSLDNCVKIGNDTTPTQLFKGQGTATINAKQLLLSSPSGGVNIQPDSINIGSSSFTFKANPTEGLGFIVNTASKGVILTPQGGVNSIGFNAKDAIVQKGGSLVGQDVSGAVYNVNGNFVNLNPLYNLESKFRDTIAIHVALDNITDASTPEEVVIKFNQLLKSLKAIGLMKPDATAE